MLENISRTKYFTKEGRSFMHGFESQRSNSRLFKLSVLSTGILCLVLGLLEEFLMPDLRLLGIFHVFGGLTYLTIGLLSSDFIRFESMLAIIIGTGVPYLAVGVLYTTGLEGSSPMWFIIFPVYAFLFTNKNNFRALYLAYTLAGVATVLFCEIYWDQYFRVIHSHYPTVLRWVVTLFGLIAIGTHIYLYESKRRRMDRIIGKQQRWLENSRRLTVAGALAGSIAHEINTPLATIQMVAQDMAEKAESGPLAEQTKEQMAMIVRVVQHINKTVKSLLNFSRRKAGEALVDQDLQSLLEEVLVLTRLRFQRHGVEFRLEPPDVSGLRLYCRPYEISQALIVLLNNGVDAVSNLEERWVEIKVTNSPDACELQITDSGKGIPDEIVPHIFDPYFTAKPEGEGTGLGLAVARQFIKDHGGTLDYIPNKLNTTFLMKIVNTPKKASA